MGPAIEKFFDGRRLVFRSELGGGLTAFGQTAGGWGRVEDAEALAHQYLTKREKDQLKQVGLLRSSSNLDPK